MEEMQQIVSILEPFEQCTKIASAENCPLSCLQYFLNVLNKHLVKFDNEFSRVLYCELDKRTLNVVSMEEVEFSSFLDPRYTNRYR
jgi:hypothetical protein